MKKLKLHTPCVITVTKDINEPRFASIKGLLKAKKAEIIRWGKNDLGLVDEEDRIKWFSYSSYKNIHSTSREKREK